MSLQSLPIRRLAAEVRHFQQLSAALGGFVGDQAWDEIPRGLPNIVGRQTFCVASAHEVVNEKLMRAVVSVGQSAEFARQPRDRMHARDIQMRTVSRRD